MMPGRINIRRIGLLMLTVWWADACLADELLDRFRREAPVAWNDYTARFDDFIGGNLEGDVEVDARELGPPNKVVYSYSVRLRRHGNLKRVEIQRQENADTKPKTDGGREVFAINSRYAFSLQPVAVKPGWTVSRLEQDERRESGQVVQWIKRVFDNNLRDASLIRLVGLSLPELFADPGCTFHTASEEGEFVRVRFDASASKIPKIAAYQSGELLLSPGRLWTLEFATLSSRPTSDEAGYEIEITYKPEVHGSTGFATAKDIDARQTGRHAGHSRHRLHLSIPKGSAREADFMLEAFGLPELDAAPATRQRESNWNWMMIISVGLLIVAGGLSWWTKSRAK
jgi:hypothetical protein